MIRESFTTEIPVLAGKVVKRAYQEAGEYHGSDDGYEADGEVVIEFEDGSSLSVVGHWCNDGTASTDYTYSPTKGEQAT